MDGSTVVEILLAVLTVAVGVGTYLSAGRAARLQSTGTLADIDAKAYDRAKGIYESAIDTLQEQLGNLRTQMGTLDAEISRLQETNRSLMRQVADLQVTNGQLTVQVAELQASNDRLLAELRRKREGNETHE